MLALKQKYANITAGAIMTYLKLCSHCQKKIKKDSKPQRCNQVDLIDMQTSCYDHYNFIMVHQDTLTKFVIIKPLKTKSAKGVAEKSYKIFRYLGPLVFCIRKREIDSSQMHFEFYGKAPKLSTTGQRDGIPHKNDIIFP